MVAAARATEVDSAMQALDFETEPPAKDSFGAARKVMAPLWRRRP
jgi:hypothetical protein